MAPIERWESYELVWPRRDGPPSAPVAEALDESLDTVRVWKHMSRVEDLGWREAQKLGIGGSKGKKRIVRKDDDIFLLKGTPSRWRLYLYVREASKRIVYVHAVSKKQDHEDPADYRTARQRFERRADGELWRIKFSC